MRRLIVFLAIVTLASTAWPVQHQTVPQTARQALIEMFFNKTPGTFMKHLPDATREVFETAGGMTASPQYYSLMTSYMESQGKGLQTFDTGSVLMSMGDPKTGQKTEIIVERDSLQGEEDDIEVSFANYKNGQPQRPPFVSHVIFSMKTEGGIWKLNQISVTIRVPLADPDLLQSVRDNLKTLQSQASAQRLQPALLNSTQTFGSSAQTFGNDAGVIAAMRNILNAEITYATTYPSVGYTCTLSDLDGFGASERNEHQAMLINSGLAGGKKFGYIFTLSGCSATPASSFRLTATPVANSFGQRTFCADQTGAIRYSADGLVASCSSAGTPLP